MPVLLTKELESSFLWVGFEVLGFVFFLFFFFNSSKIKDESRVL